MSRGKLGGKKGNGGWDPFLFMGRVCVVRSVFGHDLVGRGKGVRRLVPFFTTRKTRVFTNTSKQTKMKATGQATN